MERNEINEFIENLREEKNLSETEASELKESLEISAKDIEPARLAVFIKAVKDEINAPASTVFSERGVNVENIKGIAKSIATVINKQQENERNLRNNKTDSVRLQNEIYEIIEQNTKEDNSKLNPEAVRKELEYVLENYENISKSEAISIAERRTRSKNFFKQSAEAKRNGQPLPQVEGETKSDTLLQMNQNVDVAMEMITGEKEATQEEREAAAEFLDNEFCQNDYRFGPGGKFTWYDDRIQYKMPESHKINYSDFIRNPFQIHQHNLHKRTNTSSWNIQTIAEVRQVETVGIFGRLRKLVEEIGKNKALQRINPAYYIECYKLDNLIKAKAASVEYIAQREDDVSKKLASTEDLDVEDLSKKTLEIIREKRRQKEIGTNFTKMVENSQGRIECKDPSMLRENTLLTNPIIRNKIAKLYFQGGENTYTIYEKLKKEGIIPEGSYLIPDDVIDVVVEEAGDRGATSQELIDLRDRERQIEEQSELIKVYDKMQDIVQTSPQEQDTTTSVAKRKVAKDIIVQLTDENDEIRSKVAKEIQKDNKAESYIKLEDIDIKDNYKAFFDKKNLFSAMSQKYNNVEQMDVTKQAEILRSIERMRQQGVISPNRDNDDQKEDK